MLPNISRKCQGLAQLQATILIATLAVAGTAGFHALGQSAGDTLVGHSTSDSTAPQLGSQSTAAAAWFGRAARWLGDLANRMDDNMLHTGVHGDSLVRQKYAGRSAAQASESVKPSIQAAKDINPPNAVAGAPEALIAHWRGPAGSGTEDMRFLDNISEYRLSNPLEDGVVEFEYVIRREGLRNRANAEHVGAHVDRAAGRVMLEVRLKPYAPRSAADRALSELIVEHGAGLTVGVDGRLVATLPSRSMMPAAADGIRGLARYGNAIDFAIAKPDGTTLARLGSPLEYKFNGLEPFGL